LTAPPVKPAAVAVKTPSPMATPVMKPQSPVVAAPVETKPDAKPVEMAVVPPPAPVLKSDKPAAETAEKPPVVIPPPVKGSHHDSSCDRSYQGRNRAHEAGAC
jgi:hypothetical protein